MAKTIAIAGAPTSNTSEPQPEKKFDDFVKPTSLWGSAIALVAFVTIGISTALFFPFFTLALWLFMFGVAAMATLFVA